MRDVQELRLVLTVSDFEAALAQYRDALGLELVNERQAEAIDSVEVGRRVAGPVRIAFRVVDSETVAARLKEAGADQLADAVITPWNDRNVRVQVLDDMQLTLFTVP